MIIINPFETEELSHSESIEVVKKTFFSFNFRQQEVFDDLNDQLKGVIIIRSPEKKRSQKLSKVFQNRRTNSNFGAKQTYNIRNS